MKKKLSFMTVVFLAAFTIPACQKELRVNEPGNLVPKTVIEDPSLPAISINGTRIHSETFGAPGNPMVLILHGGPGADYRSMLHARDLANDGYFVIFYDQRGSGLSQRQEKSSYSIQLLLDDLTAVISYYRKSSNQKVFLLGKSWGAMLATAYINSYPAAINGLILVEPGGLTWDQTRDYISRTRKSSAFNEDSNDAFYQDQVLTGNENEHDVLDYKMAISSAFDTKEGNALGIAGPYPFWRYGAVVQSALFDLAKKEHFDFTTNLSHFKTKALFCYSEFNKAYGFEYARLLSSAYSLAQLEMIHGVGHEVLYFGWNELYPLIRNYLDSLR